MCGIVGIVGKTSVNQAVYDALTILQHRGQDAAGIVTCDGAKFNLRKSNGMVSAVFRTRDMLRLTGTMGIGHVRYPTAGSSSMAEAQPFYVNSPYGITLAHNGNLTNAAQIAADLFRDELRHINTRSDSEVLLNVLAHQLQKIGAPKLKPEHVFDAVAGLHQRCRGAYASVALIAGYGLLAFRDPNGIRPLIFGQRKTELGLEYMFASESVALSTSGFEVVRDVAPGEAVFVTMEGELYTQVCADKTQLVPCIFEYVYLARPDSIMDGISVYKARLRMGEQLADKILRTWPEQDIDVVVPIPDTSRTAALEVANRLGVKYREGFVKNRYIGRTFIMPGQTERKKSVRQKLNAIALEFHGKNVLLVDDSIVRGTTCSQIIQMAREAGAKKVYFASAAPAVKYPNVYGIDVPTAAELIAYERESDEIAGLIGADALIYQDLEDLWQAAREGNPDIQRFESSVFDADYVTGGITQAYLDDLALGRNDETKQRQGKSEQSIDLHNPT